MCENDKKNFLKVFEASRRKKSKEVDVEDTLSLGTNGSRSLVKLALSSWDATTSTSTLIDRRCIVANKSSLQDLSSVHRNGFSNDKRELSMKSPEIRHHRENRPCNARRHRRIHREDTSLALNANLQSTPRSNSPPSHDGTITDTEGKDQDKPSVDIYAFLEEAIKSNKKNRQRRREEHDSRDRDLDRCSRDLDRCRERGRCQSSDRDDQSSMRNVRDHNRSPARHERSSNRNFRSPTHLERNSIVHERNSTVHERNSTIHERSPNRHERSPRYERSESGRVHKHHHRRHHSQIDEVPSSDQERPPSTQSQNTQDINQLVLFETFAKLCSTLGQKASLTIPAQPAPELNRSQSHKSLQCEVPINPVTCDIDQQPVRLGCQDLASDCVIHESLSQSEISAYYQPPSVDYRPSSGDYRPPSRNYRPPTRGYNAPTADRYCEKSPQKYPTRLNEDPARICNADDFKYDTRDPNRDRDLESVREYGRDIRDREREAMRDPRDRCSVRDRNLVRDHDFDRDRDLVRKRDIIRERDRDLNRDQTGERLREPIRDRDCPRTRSCMDNRVDPVYQKYNSRIDDRRSGFIGTEHRNYEDDKRDYQKTSRSYDVQREVYPDDMKRTSRSDSRRYTVKERGYDSRNRRFDERHSRYNDEPSRPVTPRIRGYSRDRRSRRYVDRLERTSVASRSLERDSARSGCSVADDVSTLSGRSNCLRSVKQEIVEQREAMDNMMKLWKELMRCFKSLATKEGKSPARKDIQDSAASMQESGEAQLRLWRECMRRYETVARDVGDTDARLMEEIAKQRSEMAEMSTMWQECLQRYRDMSSEFNTLKKQLETEPPTRQPSVMPFAPPRHSFDAVNPPETHGVTGNPGFPPPFQPAMPRPGCGYPTEAMRGSLPMPPVGPPDWWWVHEKDRRRVSPPPSPRRTPRHTPQHSPHRERSDRHHRKERDTEQRFKKSASKHSHAVRSDNKHRKR